MGQSKRRSKSDSNYGKVFDLSSGSAKAQHCDAVVQEMFTTFNPQFKILVSTKTFPDNYQSICERITVWFNQRLLKYHPCDREYIAQFIIGLAAAIGDQFVQDRPFTDGDTVSPALFCCLFQVTRSFLKDEAVNDLKFKLQKSLKKVNQNDLGRPFAEAILNY